MAYVDPASNPGSKPQRFSVKNCKTSTSDKLQTFKTIFGISYKFLNKNYLHEINPFFEGESHAREITEPMNREESLGENFLY